MKTKRTKKQRAEFMKNVISQWKVSNKLADEDQGAKEIFDSLKQKNRSYHAFYFVLKAMRELGLEGLPYKDCRTYGKWKEAGFQVEKGESSKIIGLTWINPNKKEEEKDEEKIEYLIPKIYKLFHRTQVKVIKK